MDPTCSLIEKWCARNAATPEKSSIALLVDRIWKVVEKRFSMHVFARNSMLRIRVWTLDKFCSKRQTWFWTKEVYSALCSHAAFWDIMLRPRIQFFLSWKRRKYWTRKLHIIFNLPITLDFIKWQVLENNNKC